MSASLLQNIHALAVIPCHSSYHRYGDFSPKTIIGRLMAMVWILFGTVMLSMFTASITTGLITAVLSNDIALPGKKVSIPVC